MTTRNFFLTGCASGIARHMTGVLLSQGHKVYATDINDEALEAHAQEKGWPADRVRTARLDVTDPDNWEEVFAEAARDFGKIDVAMNIAGYLQSGWLHEAPVHEVHRHVDINGKGVIFGTQVAARHMIGNKSGHIVNISSIAGLVPVPGMALYSAAKYMVRSYSLAAAAELRPHGVYVTVICPFSVQTPLLERQLYNTEASMMFSCPALTVEDIEKAIVNRALKKKPLEVWIPRRRCWLARFIDVFPSMAGAAASFYNSMGRSKQARLQEKETAAAR